MYLCIYVFMYLCIYVVKYLCIYVCMYWCKKNGVFSLHWCIVQSLGTTTSCFGITSKTYVSFFISEILCYCKGQRPLLALVLDCHTYGMVQSLWRPCLFFFFNVLNPQFVVPSPRQPWLYPWLGVRGALWNRIEKCVIIDSLQFRSLSSLEEEWEFFSAWCIV